MCSVVHIVFRLKLKITFLGGKNYSMTEPKLCRKEKKRGGFPSCKNRSVLP